MLAIMLYWPSPVLIMVCILSLPQIMRAWRYDGLSTLTGFLVIMTHELHEMLGAMPHR